MPVARGHSTPATARGAAAVDLCTIQCIAVAVQPVLRAPRVVHPLPCGGWRRLPVLPRKLWATLSVCFVPC